MALADRVGDGADLGPILGRQGADAAQDAGQPALLAEDVELERLERGDVRGGRDRGERLRLERLEVAGQVGEVHVLPWFGSGYRGARPRITSPRASLTFEGSG